MRRRSRNPPPPFHEEDREPITDLIRRVCGCSDRTTNQILTGYPEGKGLASATKADLRALGATPTQATRLQGAFELGRRVQERELRYKPQLRQPRDVTGYLRSHLPHLEQESFFVIFLDPRQRVMELRQASMGSLAAVDVHPREIFRDAIRMRAHSIIVAHNHPAGDPDPSKRDIELTQKLADVGRLVGIPLLDHLIVGGEDAVSLAELGLIQQPR